MSLRTRIALLVGVTVLVASAIGGLGTSISSRNVGRDRVDRALQSDAEPFADNPRRGTQLQFAFEARRAACDDPESADVATNQTRGLGAGRLRLLPEFASNVQRIRPTGAAVAACQTLPVNDVDREIAAAGAGTVFRTVSVEGERFRVLTVGYDDIGAVQFARSLEITDDTLRSLLVRSIGFGVLGAILASGLGWMFAKQATEPVKRLSAAAQNVAQTKDLGERIDVSGDDEIAALATSFNSMLASLDTSRTQQQRLVQDASHELRTPLTSMRTNVELLQRHTDIEADVREQILADIGAELQELTALTSELVESATEVPPSIQLVDQVDLFELVTDCVERGRRRHRPTIEVIGGASLVAGDVGLLGRCVTNLINNAAKFSDDDTPIEVEVSAGSVTVRDRGSGIPDEDIQNIFERFYRATSARSAPGSGLGLSIVRQIVEGHGGTVHATNRLDGGAAIGFTLPQTIG